MATPKPTSKPTVKAKVTPKPTAKPSSASPIDQLIKAGVKKLSPGQKAQIAKILGIKYDPKVTNPNYKGNPKDINPDWKP